MDTDPYSAQTFSDAARGSATLVWSSPQNATIGSPTATDGGFLPGLLSHFLSGAGFAPSTPIPAGSTVTGLTLYVRHRLTGTGFPTPANLAAVQVGAFSASPARPVPASFEDYAVPVTTLPTLAQVNAGLTASLGYDAVPADPNAFDASNWTVVVSPASPQTKVGGSPSQTWAVTATWKGSGAAPLYVPLVLTGSATGGVQGTGGSAPTSSSGSASADDGLGHMASGRIQQGNLDDPDPSSRTASGTKRVLATPGTPYSVTMTATGTMSPGSWSPRGDFSLSASVTTPDPSTVEVESVYMVASYTNPSPPQPPPPAVVPYRPNLSRIPSLTPTTPTIR